MKWLKKELGVGDEVPGLCLPDQDGEEACLDDFRGRWVILYFYPRNGTRGCTMEAQAFTAAREEFEEMAAAHLILRATEPGLVAHPIAGFDEAEVESLGIPEEYQVIALVIVGRHSGTIHPYLTETQAEAERKRPERFPLNKFASINRYLGKADPTSVTLK